MARFPVVEWYVDQVRVSAFFEAPIPNPDQRQWWNRVIGSEPEARVAKPRTGAIEEAGAFDNARLGAGPVRLVMSSEPLRADFRLQPKAEVTGEPPNIGALPHAIRTISEIGRSFFTLGDSPPMRRLAFGCHLTHPAESPADALRQLSDYLPALQIDSDGSKDLIYQINRRRPSATNGITINRLSKWSSAVFQATEFLDSGVRPIAMTPMARVEIDVNTPGERREALPREALLPLLAELSELTLEIATEGDIR